MITSEVKRVDPANPDYPRIEIADSGLVVIFAKANEGTVLRAANNGTAASRYAVGEYSNAWNQTHFKPFFGEITLRQDR